MDVVTHSAEETVALGRRIGEQLRGGEVFGLVGPLGSGKTHLIKGIAAGLGAEGGAEAVSSPTFVLVNEYRGRLELYHIDAYRLETTEQFEQIGFDDYCHPGAVVVIEWADKVQQVLKGVDLIAMKLAHLGRRQREITMKNLPAHVRF